MRELKVVGLEPDAKHIVCTDKESGDKFRIAADDRLRAALRGDLARFGQIEIEMDAALRPREIQARIRAGASVEQVAAQSGMPASRVERFAYPVLLERSRAAQLAQKGHPVRGDGPMVNTLEEVVGAAFRGRGHNLEQAEWDAWKHEDGYWVVQLEWQVGRTSIAAHWRFQPDGHGGSLTALDEAATDLVDPDFGRQLRGLTPVPTHRPEKVTEQHTLDEYYDEVPDEPVHNPKQAPTHPNPKDRRGKPAMPSWEDVLLGVRSSGH
ncbi:DUF3071 domain-containing protein [Skermania sp. ID1734]|uniref:septation protein SepH n=1 Tax=Skermania sp. ID1734 TaxID=2597516 RepID=UPI0011816A1F|nr:septation protein SepH [Skermania sp. ID1734]TSD96630.1 DUF3071 domain-containing protein [Skermania sp. ID1734]